MLQCALIYHFLLISFFLSLVSFSSLFSLLSHFSFITPSHPSFFPLLLTISATFSHSLSLKSHKKHPYIVANYPKNLRQSQTLSILPCNFGLLLRLPSSQRTPYLSPPPLKLKLQLKVKSHPSILAQEDSAMFTDSRLLSPRGLLCNVGAGVVANTLFCLLPEKIDRKKMAKSIFQSLHFQAIPILVHTFYFYRFQSLS